MWIVPERDRIPSVVTTPRDGAGITGAVIHTTGSPFGAGPHADESGELARLRRWADGSPRSSTHFVILRTGRVVQMVPLDVAAEHTSDARASWGTRTPVDRYTIGIDLMNVGALARDGDVYRNGYGGVHHGSVAHDAQGRPWEGFTHRQIEALWVTVPRLIAAVPALGDPDAWTGHEDIQAGKVDPGPLFPWVQFRGMVVDVNPTTFARRARAR